MSLSLPGLRYVRRGLLQISHRGSHHYRGPYRRSQGGGKIIVLDSEEKQAVSLAICVALNVRSSNIPRLALLYMMFNSFMLIKKRTLGLCRRHFRPQILRTSSSPWGFTVMTLSDELTQIPWVTHTPRKYVQDLPSHSNDNASE